MRKIIRKSVQKRLKGCLKSWNTIFLIKALMEKLGLKSREGFRRNYLHPAVEVNLIRMTIPDKPNSRNQRYVKI